MRIVCLITVGSFLLSIAISDAEVSSGNNVQRIPRALVLQPVMKVKEDDEEPFDFISNWISRMIHPPKKPSQARVPQMLGPIRVPGLNDDVFIKQIEPNSNVVIRVRTRDHQKPMPMTYYPVSSPTRQVPMQSSGFVPIPSPTWSRPYQPVQQPQYTPAYSNNMSPYRNDYSNYQNEFSNNPDYSKNFRPHQNYQNHRHYRPQYQSQSFRPAYDSRYVQQNPYGSYDYHNSMSGTSGFNYGGDSQRPTNYSPNPPIQERPQENSAPGDEEKPLSISSEEASDTSQETSIEAAGPTYETINLPNASPTSEKVSSVSSKFNEIFRSDRMVPTNPTYRNRFWTRVAKTSTTSTTLRPDDNQLQSSSKKKSRYSLKSIQEIPAPDLKAWKESMEQLDDDNDENNNEDDNNNKKEDKILKTRDTDSRMDEDGITMKDDMTLGKGESQEHVDKDSMILRSIETVKNTKTPRRSLSGDIREAWKPINSVRTTVATLHEKISMQKLSEKLNTESNSKTMIRNSTRVENVTPEVLQKVMSLTAHANHSWRPHHDTKKANKRTLDSLKNSNRRVRIVESVRSSVSMTSSKGVKKPKTKT